MNEEEGTIFIIRTAHEAGEEISMAFESEEDVLREVGSAINDEGVVSINVERMPIMRTGQPVPKLPRVQLAE